MGGEGSIGGEGSRGGDGLRGGVGSRGAGERGPRIPELWEGDEGLHGRDGRVPRAQYTKPHFDRERRDDFNTGVWAERRDDFNTGVRGERRDDFNTGVRVRRVAPTEIPILYESDLIEVEAAPESSANGVIPDVAVLDGAKVLYEGSTNTTRGLY